MSLSKLDLLSGVDDRLETRSTEPIVQIPVSSCSQLGGESSCSPVDGESGNIYGQSTEVSNVPREVSARGVGLQDGTAIATAKSAQGTRQVEERKRTNPKWTESTLMPSGSSASAALPAIPPS